jgi:hypothetical protein
VKPLVLVFFGLNVFYKRIDIPQQNLDLVLQRAVEGGSLGIETLQGLELFRR